MHSAKAQAPSSWDRQVAALASKVVSGAAILPIEQDGPPQRRLQSMRKRACRCGQQRRMRWLRPSWMEGAPRLHHGRWPTICTDNCERVWFLWYSYCQCQQLEASCLVKTQKALVLAVYGEPVTAADAIPCVRNLPTTCKRK